MLFNNINKPFLDHKQVYINYSSLMSSQGWKKDAQYFVTTAVSFATLLSGFRMLKYQLKLYQTRKQIRQIETNQVVQVDDLQKRGLKVNQLLLLHGYVGTKDQKQVTIQVGNSFIPGQAKKQKFAIHLSYSEPIYSNEQFDSQKTNYVFDLKSALKRSTSLSGSSKITLCSQLKGDKKKGEIFIKNFDQKDYSKVLNIVKWQQQKRKLSFGQDLNVFFLSLFQGLVALGSVNEKVPYIRGMQIGKRDIELGIKIGASISILGTVGVTTDGEFFIEASNIFRDRLTQITSLNEVVEEHIGKRNFFLFCTLVGGTYLARRAYLTYQKLRGKEQ